MDNPLIEISYTDEGEGVDISSLDIILNGQDTTGNFVVGNNIASLQVIYEEVLPEGLNVIRVTVADRVGNVGEATSAFNVATPTEVLLYDLREGPPAASRRAALKLLPRRSELARLS